MQKINLIWQTKYGEQTTFEFEYTTEVLFKHFEQNRIFDNGSLSTVIDNSVIIYSNNSNNVSEEFEEYLNKFVNKGYKFFLLHFSNESLNHNSKYYSKSNHVFRNYYDSNINLDNVTFIPLGFKSGFLEKETESPETKEYLFSFVGQSKSDRGELLDILESFENVFIHKTNSWNCPTSLSQNECKQIYKKTKFVPCPMGWEHPDSFRIMECLESGTIPILKNYNNLDYFSKVWGESPIPVVNHWEEINVYKEINDNDYQTLQKKVTEWFIKFKLDLSSTILKKINEHLF